MGKDKTSIKSAALVNALGKYSKIVLTLLMNIVLARILSPADFGVVAVITVFSTFFSTLSDMGLSTAIIQDKSLSCKDISSLYTFSLYVSAALMLVFAACSFPLAHFYDDRAYAGLGLLLSISLFFNSMNMVPNGILNRDKRFMEIALRTIVTYTLASALTIFLALTGLRYYALAINAVLVSLIQFIWNWLSTRPGMVWKIDWPVLRRVGGYSGFQFAFNMVNYFSRNLDNLLTGKFMGAAPLGQYNKAYGLMLFPVSNLSGVVSPILHPVLSDYQNDVKIIYSRYMKVVRTFFLLGTGIACISWLASREIVVILYGDQWDQASVCFRLLSFAIIPQMLNSGVGAIFQSLGNTRLLFWNGLLNSIITVTAILLGIFVWGDIASLSICVSTAYILHFFTAYYMLIVMGFRFRMMSFLKDLLPEFVILAVLALVSSLYPFQISNLWLSAICKGAWVGCAYILCLLISGEYKKILELFRK